MDADRNFKPFRWDLSRREQLPQVPLSSMAVFRHWPQVRYSPDFDSELRICAARVIAAAGDTDWVFVGRSPEHLFDYLSGIFESVPNAPALTHLLFSLRYGGSASSTAANNPVAMAALSSYFAAERLHPSAIAARERGVTFIDVVDSGTTFRNLIECLKLWNNRHKGDWNAVQRRLRFIGLTPRKKTSPNTWRWQQHQDWLAWVPDATVKNVSVPVWVCQWMAGSLPKLTPSHTVDRWALLRGGGPARNDERLAAVHLACRLYDLGRSREERLALSAEIAKLPGMRDPWLRTVVLKLRKRSKRS